MERELLETNASQLVADNYTDYAKYVLETRALPQVNDGLKLVQRRIIYTANQHPLKLMKTAALAGSVMRMHPHGDCSGSIYTMTSPCNKLKIFNIKGNHGGPGWGPSASRYTECYLNEVGRFNYCQFIDYADYYEGELGLPEPVSLPCLIPYALIEGSSGMGVGLSSEVMPLNILDLIEYYKDVIQYGSSNRLVRPDVGDFILHNDENLSRDVESAKCSLRFNPIITREGNSLVFTSMLSRSIDYLIRKLGNPDAIEYRNESGAVGRHVFTVIDNKDGITVDDVNDWMNYHTKSTQSYSRTMVDTDKNAVYCTLSSVVNASLLTLNKAIDKMIASKISSIEHKLELYEALNIAKSHKVFNDLATRSNEQLIQSMVVLGISNEISKEICKKPISYLTKDHDSEMKELVDELAIYENHDRVQYLLNMYDTFKLMIMDDYRSKLHTVLETECLHNPRVRLRTDSELEVYEGKRGGTKLGGICFLVDKSGYCRIHYVSVKTYKIIPLDNPQVGFTTDAYKYLEVQTIKDKKGISFRIEDLKYSKNLLNLNDDESVVQVIGWNDDAPDRVLNNLVTKRSKTRWY